MLDVASLFWDSLAWCCPVAVVFFSCSWAWPKLLSCVLCLGARLSSVKDCWTCCVFYSMLLFPLGLWGNLYILVCFLCGVSCCRRLLCFLWKVSCFIFNITLAVLRMVDLKLSSGTGPLILRKRCQSILAQPRVVIRLITFSKHQRIKKATKFPLNLVCPEHPGCKSCTAIFIVFFYKICSFCCTTRLHCLTLDTNGNSTWPPLHKIL